MLPDRGYGKSGGGGRASRSEPPRRGRLLTQELLHLRNRLVGRLLGGEAVGHDAVDGRAEAPERTLALETDVLLPVEAVEAPDVRLAQELHHRLQPVRVAGIEPEGLGEHPPRR